MRVSVVGGWVAVVGFDDSGRTVRGANIALKSLRYLGSKVMGWDHSDIQITIKPRKRFLFDNSSLFQKFEIASSEPAEIENLLRRVTGVLY